MLCAPFSIDELRARVDVRRRLSGWTLTKPDSVAKKPELPRSVLTELRAWEYLGDVIADDFAAMFSRPLRLEAGWIPPSNSLQVATITMSLPSEQLELCISLAADTATRRWLGETLLGDPDAPDDSLDDVMREMANVAGGALKRAAMAEGPLLSTGIPVDGRSLPARDSGTRCWTILLDDSAVVAVIGEVRRRVNRRIPAKRLSEGMVVVGDIRNGSGVLLLPAGTRLTLTTAERLSQLLETTLVEVSG